MWEKPPPLQVLQSTLTQPSNPIGMRMRAAYYLKHYHDTNDETNTDEPVRAAVANALSCGLRNPQHG